jgi:hypothetical protein
MSASNYNWVCFTCHFVTRQPKSARRIPKCSECGSDCYCLGYKVEIPKKSNTRGWKTLRLESRKRHLELSDQQAVRQVRTTHIIERRITHLLSLGPNKDRQKMITELKKKTHA